MNSVLFLRLLINRGLSCEYLFTDISGSVIKSHISVLAFKRSLFEELELVLMLGLNQGLDLNRVGTGLRKRLRALRTLRGSYSDDTHIA